MSISQPVIVIAYPEEWGCYAKLSRKLEHILSKTIRFSVIYPHDKRGFINKFFSGDARVSSFDTMDNTALEATHGIVFDDGVSFQKLKIQLGAENIQLRLINVEISHIVNIDKQDEFDVYIGRGSGFGNPYAIGIEGDDRDEVIRKFKYDFDRDYLKDNFKTRLLKHRGKQFGCHCKPVSCHGDVLVEFLNSYDDGM
ncbi:MAG: DUF4326 domain-containing protein [Gammaproteobacteria bacterium]